MLLSPDSDDWSARAAAALTAYAEPLLRAVAGRLVKPRTQVPVEELVEKAVATLLNPPVIDRRVKELPPAARKLLALVGRSRQSRWKVGHLIAMLSSLGHVEGFTPVQVALENGLLFPEVNPHAPPISDFAAWLGSAGSMAATVFVHPAVAARARGEDLELPNLATAEPPVAVTPRVADGLEWPLRLAAVWQQVAAGPVRMTQANLLFKRDQTRLQADEVLSAPIADGLAPVPEAGVLALFWAATAGLLESGAEELRAAPFPPEWAVGLTPVLVRLAAALPHVEAWDPLTGYAPAEGGMGSAPSAGLLALLLLAGVEDGWVTPADVAAWLWEHHPSWAGGLTASKDRGAGWVAAYLLGVCYPLRLVEAAPVNGGFAVRLSALGRHLYANDAEPPGPPAFPQTLLVQPNAEILAYRQGLTPVLIGTLSRFARWKGIGPACTLELTPEHTYRGLESGLTLPMILQALARHSARPVPPSVADLLQRWSNKRERITVFASAVLVEFPTAADLDAAVARGIVSVKLTDRIGLTADGKEPPLGQLRLIANRDYEGKPQRCVTVADDGLTLTVDAAQADLLLDAEIGRYAEPLPSESHTARRFRLTPASLRRAADLGLTLADIDQWFLDRTGAVLSAAGRLFLSGAKLPPPSATRQTVVRFPTDAATDGVMQWPQTRELIAERLGPTAVVVDEEHLEALRRVLAEIGVVGW